MHGEPGGVDHEVGHCSHFAHEGTFAFDHLLETERSVAHRVPSTCRLVAAHQLARRSLEEEHPHPVTLLAKSLHRTENAGLLAAVAHDQAQLVDLTAGLTAQLDDLVDEHDRKVVDDEPSHVFQICRRL